MGLPAGALAAELTAIDAAARDALRDFRAAGACSVSCLCWRLACARLVQRARHCARLLALPTHEPTSISSSRARKQNSLKRSRKPLASSSIHSPTRRPSCPVAQSMSTSALFSSTPISPLSRRSRSTHRIDGVWNRAGLSRLAVSDASRRPSVTRYHVTAPADATLTQPYFLVKPRRGSLYDWPADAPQGLPFDAPLLSASVTLTSNGTEFTITRPVRYRFADRVRGELRRDVNVVPELSVGLDSNLLVVPTSGAPRPQRLVATATSFANRTVTGTLRLVLPAGWTSTPTSAPFSVTSAGDSATATFVVTPPVRRTAGAVTINAEAKTGDRVFSASIETVAYPHIQNHRLYSPAAARVEVIDLVVAPVQRGLHHGQRRRGA